MINLELEHSKKGGGSMDPIIPEKCCLSCKYYTALDLRFGRHSQVVCACEYDVVNHVRDGDCLYLKNYNHCCDKWEKKEAKKS